MTRSPADTLKRGRLDPDALIEPFDIPSGANLIAAVSGGSDSLALLDLLHAASRKRNWRIHVATVDHGLRSESATEAQTVGERAAWLGLPHRVLRWEGPKPSTGIQAAARAARYQLLKNHADEIGSDFILTGHTQDDQIETVRMREVRGNGRGLAGMAPATLLDGRVWLLRPLLETGRHDLRLWLNARQIDWIDDPSNSDPRFERVRVRKAQEYDKGHILRLRAQAEKKRIALGIAAAQIVRNLAAQPSPGLLSLAAEAFAFGDAGLYAFRALIACAGGQEHLPDPSRSDALWRKLEAGPIRASLGGAVIERRKAMIWLHRETRHIAGIAAHRDKVFDGRFRLKSSLPGTIVANGAAARPTSSRANELPPRLVSGAMAAQPALRGESGRLVRLDEERFEPLVPPFARILLAFDTSLAQALAGLFGARKFPSPPYAGRKDRLA
nr:tRNA lysidine(34) synthetase TilS [Mesorhizobium liriopis]